MQHGVQGQASPLWDPGSVATSRDRLSPSHLLLPRRVQWTNGPGHLSSRLARPLPVPLSSQAFCKVCSIPRFFSFFKAKATPVQRGA